MKIVQKTLLAAATAAALLTAVALPAQAFTLQAPGAAVSHASPNVDHVWYDRWGRWHPNRPWGWGGPRWGGPGPWGWHRCWINGWGRRICR